MIDLDELIAGNEDGEVEFKSSFGSEAIRTLSVDLKKDNYRSSLRNVLIEESFYLFKEIEKYGSGMVRIRRELMDYPEIELDLFENGNNFDVVFRKRAEIEATTKETTKETTKDIPEKIMALMIKKPDISINEISKVLDLSYYGVYYHIRNLKRKGKIRRSGSTKKGNWEVIEDE